MLAKKRTAVAMQGIGSDGGDKTRPASVHAQSLDMSSAAQSLDGGPSSGEPAFSPVAANTADGIKPVNQEPGSAKRTAFRKRSIPFDQASVRPAAATQCPPRTHSRRFSVGRNRFDQKCSHGAPLHPSATCGGQQ